MRAEPSTRLLDHLPAIYRSGEPDDELPLLLGVFEELLFTGHDDPTVPISGIGRQLDAVPALFAPLGLGSPEPHPAPGDAGRSPERFVPWLATWLSFSPRELFEPERLRHIVAGIVPLYGKRGTRAYLEQLLLLCFDEIAAVEVDEHHQSGLRVGLSSLGVDSLLGQERPFWFRVDVELRRDAQAPAAPAGAMRLEDRVRAIIDFAKPAHTTYDLRMHRHPAATVATG